MPVSARKQVFFWATVFVAGLLSCSSSVWAVEGDGSLQGSVAATGSEVVDAQAADNQYEDADVAEDLHGLSTPDEAPVPLDASGNEVSDGQVSDASFLYDAAIADLVGADSYYNGQTVQIRGEAVGEAIRVTGTSLDSVWITLADVSSNSSVAVVMSREDAAKIDTYGSYGKTGSRLCVQGVFNLACSEHEGESDIHATSVVVEEQGAEHPDEFDVRLFFPGLAALAAGAFLAVIFWYIRERSR